MAKKIWFTADQHFGHANIISYCGRPFADVSEMNAEMIRRWNAVVSQDDIVYHLGDFTLGNLDQFLSFRRQLNGAVLWVPGGHDGRWAKRVETLPPLVTINIDGWHVTLCHYPMLSWEQSHYGMPHLHGHTHGTIPDALSSDRQLPPGQRRGVRIDIGVDRWAFAPVSWDEVRTMLPDGPSEASQATGPGGHEPSLNAGKE